MGHSNGFEDARWLARWILASRSSDQRCDDLLRLPAIGISVYASGSGGEFRLTFRTTDGDDLNPLPELVADEQTRDSVRKRLEIRRQRLMDAWKKERVLLISPGRTEHQVQSPKRWRMDIRQALRTAQSQVSNEGSILPFFARHHEIFLNNAVDEQELLLQIFILFYQWGFDPNMTQEDLQFIVAFICKSLKRGGEFRAAAEETVPLLLTNFVMPQDALDFRRYFARVAWYLYSNRTRYGQFGIDHSQKPDWIESLEQQEDDDHPIRPKPKSKPSEPPEFVTPRQVAIITGLHFQRVYEAIKRGELPSSRFHGHLVIEPTDAEAFAERMKPKRVARAAVKQLRSEGKNKEAEALRKRIQRLRKAGASDQDVLQMIKAERDTMKTRSSRASSTATQRVVTRWTNRLDAGSPLLGSSERESRHPTLAVDADP